MFNSFSPFYYYNPQFNGYQLCTWRPYPSNPYTFYDPNGMNDPFGPYGPGGTCDPRQAGGGTWNYPYF
jgi:hypothetical protein